MQTTEKTALLEESSLALHSALKRSEAPRFLLPLIAAELGEYRVEIDDLTLTEPATGTLIVRQEGGYRSAHLQYVHRFAPSRDSDLKLDPVYTHFAIEFLGPNKTPHLLFARSLDPWMPDEPSISVTLVDLANQTSIEDFCDFAGIPLSRDNVRKEGPKLQPLEEE